MHLLHDWRLDGSRRMRGKLIFFRANLCRTPYIADSESSLALVLSSVPRAGSAGEPRTAQLEEEISMTPQATSITAIAEAFFDACETGKGWEVCSAYCTPDATFAAQAEPLLELKSLAQYTDWMKGILPVLPDAHYEVRCFAADHSRNRIAAYGVFHATHTGEGGPVPPTGRSTSTDYVYVMQFEGDKITHMTKIWNAGLALKDLGWV
jgi:predicted ester cyclase